MNIYELFLPVFMVFLLFTPQAHAESFDIVIDLGGVISAVNSNANSTEDALEDNSNFLGNAIGGIPNGIINTFKSNTKDSLQEFNTLILSLAVMLLSINPDTSLMFDSWQAIVFVLSSFYLILFLVIGLKFMTIGDNIQKREEAKESLKNIIIMIIGINISFVIYQLALELSTAITQFMWFSGFEYLFEPSTYSGAGLILLLLVIGSIVVALVTLFARYLFLLMGVILFPLGIFCYLTTSLRGWGRIIFNFLGIVLAMQLVDVILLVAVAQIMSSLAGEIGVEFVPVLGFTLLTITNIVILVYAIVKSAFSAVDNAPMLKMAIGTLTGQIGSLARSGSK